MWPNPQETADLVTFTEEIFNGKLHFLYSVFLSFFLLFFFFNRYIPWQTLAIHRIAGKGKGIIIFLVSTSTRTRTFFSSSRFLQLLFNRSFCNYQTDSWWDLFSLEICILFAFLLKQFNRSYWLWHFKATLRGFELISNYRPSIAKRTPWLAETGTPSHHCLSIPPTQPYPWPPIILYPFAKMYISIRDWEKNNIFTMLK